MSNPSTDDLLALAARYDADFNPNSPPIVIERGEGATITDTEGHTTIDLGDIIANIGHCHPRHVAALREAVGQMLTGKSGLTNPPRSRLVAKLAEITPDELDKVYLVVGGSEAVDWAIRIARRFTGRHEILTFWGGVYGRTYATTSMNGLMRRRRRFGPVMPGVIHAPFPYCYRCPFGKQPEDCNFFCVDYLDEVMLYASTDDLAALVIEPYLGVGGIIFPPEGYLPRLQRWAAERDALFILDEVQSSFGRTGKWFALEWEDLSPNMICIGKGMGSGVSIAAIVGESRLFDSLNPGELSGGNGGNYLACTSALTVIDIMEDEQLVEHARQIGNYFMERLTRWKDEFAVIGDVRGKGLVLAMEFVKDRETKMPFPEIVKRISQICYQKGVSCGGRSHILDIRPPLVITQEQAVFAADVIESALREVTT
ncbi:MAG: aspartate aminotransferase family protein [Anaerolineaceae bacterium]|nr:aspartate aminotransferase family protein [Anaerolineaceae bacterium]